MLAEFGFLCHDSPEQLGYIVKPFDVPALADIQLIARVLQDPGKQLRDRKGVGKSPQGFYRSNELPRLTALKAVIQIAD